MADIKIKLEQNIQGEYYVDSSCKGCGLCVGIAPNNFKLVQEDKKYAYVYKQPDNDYEVKKCEKALEICYIKAIGNNG